MRLPPFSRLAEKYPQSAEMRIYVGDNALAWNVTRTRNSIGPAILVPASEDFRDFSWPVAKRDALIMRLGPFNQVPEFAAHLLIHGAAIVRALHGDKLDIYRRG